MNASAPIEMLSPTGERRMVTERHAGTLRALGYKDVMPALEAELAERARLGGTVGEIAAAGLGFARGSSFGLSDLAIRAGENAGVLPEGTTDDVRKLKEFNPTASIGGELASFVTPGLGAVKALGAAGKVAKSLGGAQAAVGAVGEALGKAAGKVAGEQLGRYVAPSVRMAAEAAAFQAGQNVSEAVLQNKDLTAESVLANTGEAAILGAGLGVGIPLGLRGAQKAATAALDVAPVRWAADKIGSQFAKFLDPQHALRIFSGAEGRSALLQNTPKGQKFQEGVKTLWDEGAYKAGDVVVDAATGKLVQTSGGRLLNRAEMAERFASLERQAGDVMGDVLDKADDAIRTGGAPKAFGFSNTDADAVIDRIAKMSKTARISDAQELALITQLEQDALRVRDAVTFNELHALRRGLDARISDKGWEAIGKPAVEISKDVRRLVSEKISSGLGELGPDVLERWQNANKIFGSLKVVGDALTKQISRAEANVNVLGLRFRDIGIGSVLGVDPISSVAIGAANKALQTDQGLLVRAMLGEKLAALGWLQKSTQATQKNVARSVSSFLKGIDAPGIGGAVTRPPQVTGALIATDAVSPEVRQVTDDQWFAETSGAIASVVADPERFAEQQVERLGALALHAPATADAIVSKQLQIYSYLHAVMPKNPGQPMNLLAPTWRPSEYQVNEFRSVVRAARKPLSVLQDLRDGVATRAQTRTVQALYPELYQSMLDEVRAAMTKPGASLPYDKELRLGLLFPGSVATMSGKFINSMSNAGVPQDEKPRRSGFRAGGTRKMGFGDRSETKTDALSAR